MNNIIKTEEHEDQKAKMNTFEKNTLQSLESERKYHLERLEMLARLEVAIKQISPLLEGLELFTAIYLPAVKIHNATRDQVLEIIKRLGGRWEKAAYGDILSYKKKLDDEFLIEIFNAPLPPQCKIVEVEEDVPAQPATKKIVRKMICK